VLVSGLMSAGVIPCVQIKIRTDKWQPSGERVTISQTFPMGVKIEPPAQQIFVRLAPYSCQAGQDIAVLNAEAATRLSRGD
jgi:hypothetical protein